MNLSELETALRRLQLANTARDRVQGAWGKNYWSQVIAHLERSVQRIRGSTAQ
jgi:hypothetical protein